MTDSLLLINIAGLGAASIGDDTPNLLALAHRGSGIVPVQPPVPALTSTSQATLLTGSLPAAHGVVANGWYFRDLAQVLNWQRSIHLMDGEKLWEAMKARGKATRCANLFWRYATHTSCDLSVMERPTYWADGRKSPDIYTEPGSARDELVGKLGPFPLFKFWGPLAGIESTRWIVDATLHVMQQGYDLILTYLPHLDYDHQRFGPASEQGQSALRELDEQAGRLIDAASERRMQVAIVSDYAFEAVSRPVYLNRVLREAGLLTVQNAENGELLEPGASKAFAVCDQQIAHVYLHDAAEVARVKQLLASVDGVEEVWDREQMREHGLDHARSGELFAIAATGCWFAYPYWLDESKAPDFARCVAIHAKPGWDPSELFFPGGLSGKLHLAKRLLQKKLGLRAPFDVISGDAGLVGGAHGRIPRTDATRAVFLCSWNVATPAVLPMQDIKPLLLG